MSEVESWLSDTQFLVATAQQVLSEVEHGLETVEKVEEVVKRTRPVLRTVAVVILGSLAGLGIVLLVGRKRRERQIEVAEGESPEDGA